MNIEASIVITSYNEGKYLDWILTDLSNQILNGYNIEVIVLEAGNYEEMRAIKYIGKLSNHLKFISIPGLSRTKALNQIFLASQGEIIISLDARSHINANYIADIINLAKRINADCVGGVMVPVGKSEEQKIIASVMSHPLSFGGGKSRDKEFCGYVDSLYLGAYKRKSKNKLDYWFDDTHGKISEDSDLNFRLRLNGGSLYLDPTIKVYYYARENIRAFFKLCYNYGVARGLFIIKHKMFSAYRQLVPIISLFAFIVLFALGFTTQFYHTILIGFILFYLFILFLVSYRISSNFSLIPKYMISFAGCHFLWMLGLLVSPIIYFKDINRIEAI